MAEIAVGAEGPTSDGGHADTANLLLSLSGMHSSDAVAEAEPDVVPMGLDPPVTPITASSTVSALPTPMNPLPTSSAAINGADSSWAAKQRRLQVSALPRKEWSADEDALIRNGVERLGCRWRLIAAQLPGRSDDAVRNRWSRLQDSIRGPGVPSSGGGSLSGSKRQSKELMGTSAAPTAVGSSRSSTSSETASMSGSCAGEGSLSTFDEDDVGHRIACSRLRHANDADDPMDGLIPSGSARRAQWRAAAGR